MILIFKSFNSFSSFLLIFLRDLTFNRINLSRHLFLKAKATSIPANPPPIITNGFAEESSLCIS